jgi:phage-related protein
VSSALAVKPKEQRKTRVASEPAPPASVAPLMEVGASVGTPIFLQRAAFSGPPGDVGRRRTRACVRTGGVPRIQAQLTVNEPDDPFERQANAVADVVMRQPLEDECTGGDCCASCAAKAAAVQRSPTGPARSAPRRAITSPTLGTLLRSPDAGAPMPTDVRQRVEPRLGVDLSGVRVHEGPPAAAMSAGLSARAFTHGGDIYLGRGESSSDVRLMAHEATHVVQQGAAQTPAVQRECASCSLEPPEIQRDVSDVIGDVVGGIAGEVSGAATAVWDETIGAIDFWAILERFAGATVTAVLRKIEQKGMVGYLSELLSGVLDNLFGGVEDGSGPLAEVMAVFAGLLDGAREIVIALRSGDCEPLFAAMRRLSEVVQQIAGEVWEAITDFFRPVGDFLSNLWTTYGAPIVEWIEELAGDIWQEVKDLGNWIWEETKPAREWIQELGGDIWSWIKELLGVGEGVEGQQGLVQWITEMAGKAWGEIKKELAPVIEPVRELLAEVRAILPMEEILNLRETIRAWLADMQEMIGTMRQPADVADQQDVLRDEILPAVLATVEALRGGIISAGEWVGGQVGALVLAVTGFIGSLRANSILKPFAAALDWVEEGVTSLGNWVRSTVSRVFAFIGDGLVRLSKLIEPVLNVLQQVIAVVGDVVGELPGLVLGFWWNLCPACIREPIKNFIIEKILRNIPIISTFLDIPDIWARIKEQLLGFLHRVFVQGDLSGAVAAVIRFVLEAVGVDVDLFLKILQNAAGSLEYIIMHPIEFMSNLFGAIMEGAGRFARNIVTHLINGLLGWLVGPLEDLGVQPPKELTLASIFEFVLQVLGVSGPKIMKKLEEAATKVLGAKAVKAIKKVARWVKEAWGWIQTLISGGWAGVWEQIKERLAGLWEAVIGGITQWISTEIVEAGIQWLAKLSNPVGWVVGAIKLIYDVLSFFVRRINQILHMVDAVVSSVGEIAAGAISTAAGWIEDAMARSVPSVLGFLASLIGIGDPAPAVHDIVESLQERVDKALDWLAEKAVNIGKGLLAMITGKDSDDVKERAKDELLSRLSAGHTLEGAQKVVDEVFAELRPEGLDSLELGPVNEGGEHLILAAASPKSKLAKLKPIVSLEAEAKHRSVIELTFKEPVEPFALAKRPMLTTTETFVKKGPLGTTGKALRESSTTYWCKACRAQYAEWQGRCDACGRRNTIVGTVSGRYVEFSGALGGVVEVPASQTGEGEGPDEERSAGAGPPTGGANTAIVRTWATGQSQDPRHYKTHAEHHFVTWFEEQQKKDPEFASRIQKIEIYNHPYSPCSACCGELRSLRLNERKLQGTITWEKAFIYTHQSDIDDLHSSGWTTGGKGFEHGAPGELVLTEVS